RRVRRRIGTEDARQLRILIGGHRQSAHGLPERFRIAAAEVLHHIRKAAAAAETEDGRRGEWDNRSAPDLAEFWADPRDDARGAELGTLAFLERFQRDNHEGRIRLRIVIDEIQTDDGGE